jgi:hypothetical protein
MTKITSTAAIARLQSGRRKAKGAPSLKLAHTFKRSLFVFNSADSFIVSPADDELPAILGVCDEGTFDKTDIPDNLKDWLNGLADEVRQFQSSGMDLMPNDNWDERKSVAPLVTAKWSQGTPYNKFLDFGEGACMVGCNAVSIGQIMHYWGVKGYHRGSKTTKAYKTGKRKYSIPSLVPMVVFDYPNLTATKPKTTASINAVATLLQYVSFAIKSDFTPTSTGAWPKDCASALKDIFNMGDGVKLVESDQVGAEAFERLVYDELAKGCPLYMTGYNTVGGHAFVCDGYDASSGMFHFNWGWGGSYNGWFALSALYPYVKDYNLHKQIIVGIKPANRLGDVNGDGSVDVSDVMNVVSIMNKGEYNAAADVNSDGKVDKVDVNLIIDKILGKETL